MMADSHYSQFSQSRRRGSTGSLYTGQFEQYRTVDVGCPKHPIQIVSSVCQNSLCAKLMCRKCQQAHASANHYKDTTTVGEFIKMASVALEQNIRTLKEKQASLNCEVKQCKQNIVSFVDQFFTHLSTEVDRIIEKAVCQLETRYLNIRKGNSMSLTDQLSKGYVYQLPNLQIDQSNICLDTVLKRMIHLTRNPYSGNCAASRIVPTVLTTTVNCGNPTIYVTAPTIDITKIINPTSTITTTKYFAFPQTSYKYNDERRNVSLQRQPRISAESKSGFEMSKVPVIKDSLLFTSRMFCGNGDKDPERPSLPAQPFAQILKTTEPQRCPLKEYVTSPNLDRTTSQRTFSPYEIQELLKKTSQSARKQQHRFAESRLYDANTDNVVGKENKDLPFMHSEKYFKTSSDQDSSARTIYNFRQNKPSTLTNLPSPINNRTAEYRAWTCTDLPIADIKPLTGDPSHRDTYQYKYARQEYTMTGGAYRL